MRGVAIVLPALLLTSCLRPQAGAALAGCGAAADKLFASAPDRVARTSAYRMDCMARRGFEWNIDETRCLDILGHDWATGHVECYRRATKSN